MLSTTYFRTVRTRAILLLYTAHVHMCAAGRWWKRAAQDMHMSSSPSPL